MSTFLIIVAWGLIELFKLGLDLENNAPLIIRSVFCFDQVSGLTLVGSVEMPRLSYVKVSIESELES
jgi:hypothetical protein